MVSKFPDQVSLTHADFCIFIWIISFQIDRKGLLQPSLHPAVAVLRLAVEFGLATSPVLSWYGTRKDWKDEERNWTNHERGTAAKGNRIFNPFIPKISLVSLLTVCNAILVMSVRRICIWSTNNPIIDIFLHSHHFSGWYFIDIVRKYSFLVIHASDTVLLGLERVFCRWQWLTFR